MKAKVLSIALTLVALFTFNTLSAQSLASYTASFDANTGTLTVSDAKVGGFGKKTTTMTVILFMTVEGSVDCYKTNRSGTMEKTFETFSEDSESLLVDGKGFGTFSQLAVSASGSAVCPGGWDFLSEGEAEVVRAWIVITGYDSNNNILKQSGEIEIVY